MHRRTIVGEALGVVALAVAAAALFGRLVGSDTDYDEGVYLVSVDALRHGQALGEDVFAPQLPGWYALLRLGGLLGADSVDGFHVWMTALAVLACLAAYAFGRRLGGPVGGLAAAALLVIAPPFPQYAHRVLADVPPLGLALAALAVAGPARGRAALAGALLGAGVCVKPTALLALPGLAVLLWPGRARAALAAAAGAAVVAAAFALAHLRALDDLWETAVVYHSRARDTPGVIDNTHELVHFLDWRTPFAWLVVLGALATVLLAARGRGLATVLPWAGPALAIAFVLEHHPLHENHLLVLPIALSVAAGIALGVTIERAGRLRLPAAALLALLLTAGYVQQHRRAAAEHLTEEPELVWAAEQLHAAAPSDRLVVSDQPIAAYLADRRVPGEIVDAAFLRFATASLTVDGVLRTIDEHDVAAVTAGRAFLDYPQLLAALDDRYARRTRRGEVRVYTSPR